MEAITVESTKDKYIISIDKNATDKTLINEILEYLQIESLAQKLGLDDAVFKIDEKIKSDWWIKNQEKIERLVNEKSNN